MQPHLAKRYKADAYLFDDIQGGDYFFICCDGVLEQLSNEALCGILADSSLDDSQKLSAIKTICDGKTRDNYTCWLIPVEEARIQNDSTVSNVIQAEEECMEVTPMKKVDPNSMVHGITDTGKGSIGRVWDTMISLSRLQVKRHGFSKWMWWVIAVLVTLSLLALVWKVLL